MFSILKSVWRLITSFKSNLRICDACQRIAIIAVTFGYVVCRCKKFLFIFFYFSLSFRFPLNFNFNEINSLSCIANFKAKGAIRHILLYFELTRALNDVQCSTLFYNYHFLKKKKKKIPKKRPISNKWQTIIESLSMITGNWQSTWKSLSCIY